MCIYEQKINDMAKNSADQKLISDIKDAVSFLNEEKLKLSVTSKYLNPIKNYSIIQEIIYLS